jgi:hypothetical protein
VHLIARIFPLIETLANLLKKLKSSRATYFAQRFGRSQRRALAHATRRTEKQQLNQLSACKIVESLVPSVMANADFNLQGDQKCFARN